MNGEFVCKNLYAAAALCAHGATLNGTTIADDGRVLFRFADPDRALYDLARAYFRGQFPPIQPFAMVDHMLNLRDKMRAALAGA
jgi:hypothetical protein